MKCGIYVYIQYLCYHAPCVILTTVKQFQTNVGLKPYLSFNCQTEYRHNVTRTSRWIRPSSESPEQRGSWDWSFLICLGFSWLLVDLENQISGEHLWTSPGHFNIYNVFNGKCVCCIAVSLVTEPPLWKQLVCCMNHTREVMFACFRQMLQTYFVKFKSSTLMQYETRELTKNEGKMQIWMQMITNINKLIVLYMCVKSKVMSVHVSVLRSF